MINKHLSKNTGFTIVEIIVVIAVLAILSTMLVFGYGMWQQNIAKDQMVADLNTVKASMETNKNFASEYDTQLPTDFVASKGVTVTFVNGNGSSYCVEAASTKTGTTKYFVSSSDQSSPKQGSCPALSVTTPTLNNANITGNQAKVTWNSVPSSTSYEIRYRVNAGAWVTTTSTISNKTITGLTLSASYDFQVRAVISGLASNWSNIISRKTLPTPVITLATDQGCGNGSGYYAWRDVSATWTATPTTYTTSYRLEGTGTYGKVPLSVNNPTGSGSLTAITSTSRWPANEIGSGTVYIYGIGPNGEKSSAGTWVSPVYPANTCYVG